MDGFRSLGQSVTLHLLTYIEISSILYTIGERETLLEERNTCTNKRFMKSNSVQLVVLSLFCFMAQNVGRCPRQRMGKSGTYSTRCVRRITNVWWPILYLTSSFLGGRKYLEYLKSPSNSMKMDRT